MIRLRRNLLLVVTLVSIAVWGLQSTADPGNDPRLAALSADYGRWLTETGLSQPSTGWELKVGQLTPIDCSVLSEEARVKMFFSGINCDSPNVPRYVLHISFKHPEKIWHNADVGWARINESFKQAHKITLDELLIFKLAHMLGEHANDVSISMDTYCKSWNLQRIKGEIRQVSGQTCKMAGESTLVTKDLLASAKNAIIGSAQTKLGARAVSGTIIARFLEAYFGEKKAVVKTVAVEDGYVEAFIENIRGEVISGKNFWERLQASIVLADKGPSIEIRLFLDGQFAAGLNPPPLTAFSDMEPTHSKELHIYAGAFLTSMKRYLEGERKP